MLVILLVVMLLRYDTHNRYYIHALYRGFSYDVCARSPSSFLFVVASWCCRRRRLCLVNTRVQWRKTSARSGIGRGDRRSNKILHAQVHTHTQKPVLFVSFLLFLPFHPAATPLLFYYSSDRFSCRRFFACGIFTSPLLAPRDTPRRQSLRRASEGGAIYNNVPQHHVQHLFDSCSVRTTSIFLVHIMYI